MVPRVAPHGFAARIVHGYLVSTLQHGVQTSLTNGANDGRDDSLNDYVEVVIIHIFTLKVKVYDLDVIAVNEVFNNKLLTSNRTLVKT